MCQPSQSDAVPLVTGTQHQMVHLLLQQWRTAYTDADGQAIWLLGCIGGPRKQARGEVSNSI